MKSSRSYIPVRLLLSVSTALLVLSFQACKDKTAEEQTVQGKHILSADDSLYKAKNRASALTGLQIFHSVKGNFSGKWQHEIACVAEKKSDNYKTAFIIFLSGDNPDSLRIIHRTELIEGNPKTIKLEKISLPDKPNDLLYFDTGNYFMGAGGGEIFYYLADIPGGDFITAHLGTDNHMRPSVFIRPETAQKKLKSFLISRIRNDFPDLAIIHKDFSL